MSNYRPLTKVAVVFSLLFVVFLAIDPFTGFGQVSPGPLTVSIGNRIYCDNNLDGQLSGGEFIPGVTVEVSLWSSEFVSTTVTDAGGNYLFTGLQLAPSVSNFITDAYTVTVDTSTLPPECDVPAVDPDDVLDNMSIAVFDANRSENFEMDFGYKAPPGIVSGTSGIGNRVYCDADLSGDATNLSHSERIPGAEVTITNIGGFSQSMLTDGSGNYLFESIAAGTYTVTVDVDTLPLACNTPFIDGDSVLTQTLGNQSVVTLLTGQFNYDQDFGYAPAAPLALVGDKIWCDDDGDLTQDAGEGIGGASVTVTKIVSGTAEPVMYNTVSGPTGLYQFVNLDAGDYTISVDPESLPASCNVPFAAGDPDGGADNEFSFSLAAGELKYNADLGYAGTLPISDIGGKSWCDTTSNGAYDIGEFAFSDVTVTLTNTLGITKTVVTDLSGDYFFENLAPDTYTLGVDTSALPLTCNAPSLDPDGTLDNQTTIVLVAAVDQLDVNFAYEMAIATPTPLPEDTPTPLPVDTATPLPVDTATPMPVDTATPLPVDTATPLPVETATPLPEETETPLPEETATPLPANTATPIPANTATPAPENTATPIPTATATQMPTVTNTPVPPTPAVGQPASIGDAVWCDNDADNLFDEGEGIADVIVTLVDADGRLSSKSTDENGNYLFEDLAPGTYIIAVSQLPLTCDNIVAEPDNTLDKTAFVDVVAGQNNRSIDFVFRSPLATISDVIWEDSNGNELQDSDEAGIEGVVVELFDTSGTKLQEVTSDVNGKYTLTGIAPTQQYFMVFTLPDGWEIAQQGPSDLDATLNTSTGQTTIFAVSPGAAGVKFSVVASPAGANSGEKSIYLPFTSN